MRLSMAAFRELAAFAQFGSDLDEVTRRQLDQGLRVQEVLKQGQYSPMELVDQIMVFFAVNNGFLDDVELRNIAGFERTFTRYMRDSHPELRQTVATGAKMSDETQDKLGQAIRDFKSAVTY
jgi:F-type H+-transporting ATPase subunit alpha